MTPDRRRRLVFEVALIVFLVVAAAMVPYWAERVFIRPGRIR